MASHGTIGYASHPGMPPAAGDPIRELLQRYKTLAVVGISPKPARPSYGVAAYMRAHGYRVISVNPNAESVFGERCYGSLAEIPGPVEVVVIFRRPEFVPEVIEDAIRKGAKAVWMQEGITHEAAARRGREAGLAVVEDRCILKEHAKRFVSEGI
ncbi:MAG: CoA-binding protein [Terriglobia bacterium]